MSADSQVYATFSSQGCNFNIINYLLLLRKISSPRISNFYVPDLSKRFLMAPRPKLDSVDFSLRNGQDEAMRDCTVPVGIIDGRRLNDKYSELTQELAIDAYQNHEAIKMIHKAIQEYECSKEPELDAHPLEFDQDDPDADATHHDREFGVQVIYLYRTTKLSHTAIALKLDVSEQFVRAWIS